MHRVRRVALHIIPCSWPRGSRGSEIRRGGVVPDPPGGIGGLGGVCSGVWQCRVSPGGGGVKHLRVV